MFTANYVKLLSPLACSFYNFIKKLGYLFLAKRLRFPTIFYHITEVN